MLRYVCLGRVGFELIERVLASRLGAAWPSSGVADESKPTAATNAGINGWCMVTLRWEGRVTSGPSLSCLGTTEAKITLVLNCPSFWGRRQCGFTRCLAEVALLRHRGLSEKAAAARLGIPYHTARARLRRLYREHRIAGIVPLVLMIERALLQQGPWKAP